MTRVDETTGAMEARIGDYLAHTLGAGAIQLHDVQRIAVGWSHETWLFSAADISPVAVAVGGSKRPRRRERVGTLRL